MKTMTTRTTVLVTTLALAAVLAACGTTAQESAVGDADGFPMTVINCDAEVGIDEPPERIVVLKNAVMSYVVALDAVDRVAAKAGAFPEGYYQPEDAAEVDAVPSLTNRLDASGHLLISSEAVIELEPDLVLGLVDTIDHHTMDRVGIPLLEASGLCPTGAPDPGFDAIYAEVEVFGGVLGKQAAAELVVDELRDRVGHATAAATDVERTAAVLYPTVGGGVTYAYGNRSMAHPIMEAAGLTNVFADLDQRVAEVSVERLLEVDPDVIVLLHSDGDPGPVERALLELPGGAELSAVREGAVITELFNFYEPASPLAVAGLERLMAATRDLQ